MVIVGRRMLESLEVSGIQTLADPRHAGSRHWIYSFSCIFRTAR